MPFKFVTNRIYTGKPVKSVEEMLKEARTARDGATVKTASAATAPVVEAPATPATTAAATPETKTAAFPKGHEEKFKANAEKVKNKGGKGPSEPTTEDKNVEEKVGKAASETELKVKVAGESAGEKGVEKYDAGKKEGSEFTNDAEKKPEDPEKKTSGCDAKPAAKKNSDGTETSGQPQWEGKAENNNNPWKDPKATDDKKASSEATLKLNVPSTGFQIVANLKPELKKRTREYWLTLYPPDYVDAMIADK